MGFCVSGQPDHRRSGRCALDGGGQAVHLGPAGCDDLGGGFGFGLLLGGLFRLGFVQLGQLVFQFVDLVGCPVQIAAQGGGFFLGLGQLGAEFVGFVGGLVIGGEVGFDGPGDLCVRADGED